MVKRITYAEYVALEGASTDRHEFLDGEVIAMAGGTPDHAAVSLAIGAELRAALRGKPCRVFGSDLRVRSTSTSFAGYPDISVVCGHLEVADDDPNAAVNPTVLVEVLSPSTEAYDRGAKALRYRRISTLREYVLVSLADRLIEVQRRTERGAWELHVFSEGQAAELASLAVRLDVSSLFADPLSGTPAAR